MVPNTFKYQHGLLVVPYISSMFHNNGGVINCREKYVSKFEQSPIDDDEGGVGGLNHTPHLVKPLVIMSLSLESHVTFVMNISCHLCDEH